TSYFPDDHTGEVIAQGLQDSLASWKLREDRLVCMTTDSVNGMKDPRIDRAIGVCKKVVSAFSFSWKKRRDMAVVQAELGLPSHNLITESLTRWGSRQLMDIDVLESMNKAVSPLKEFTDALSGEAYMSVSYLKPVIHLLNNSLLQPEEGETELTKQIKSNILNYLNNKYNDPVTQELLDMASLMDPRFRTTYIADDKVDGIKKRAVTELMSLPAEKSKSQPGTSVQDLHQEEAAEPVTKKKKTLASFFKKKTVSSTSQSEQDKIEAELSSYLLSSETDPDTDPLQWWKLHEANFPRLSNLAKKYLSIPAT
ncbi:Zinc finger BED domain containing protein 1, partial [Dissostichus eleginoides]